MIKTLFIVLYLSFLFSKPAIALTISQCRQPDGTIEFTNKGCTKNNQLFSRQRFSSNSKHNLKIKKISRRKAKAAFLQTDFVHLQKKLLQAKDEADMKVHALTITRKIKLRAQQGEINSAYNMLAFTYAQLSKEIKQKKWMGQPINDTSKKIHLFFEQILITQSTITSSTEFNQAIETAWQNSRLSSDKN